MKAMWFKKVLHNSFLIDAILVLELYFLCQTKHYKRAKTYKGCKKGYY